MKENLIVIGCSATAKRIFRFVKMYDLYNVIGFAIDKQYKTADSFMGLPVYEIEELKNIVEEKAALLFVAIFWNKLNSDRKLVYQKLKDKGYEFANIISPTAIVRGDIIGTNCWINDLVVIQSDARIGNNVFIMDTSLIGNETIINDHCFIAPSRVGGGVTLGKQCFVGINALIFDDTVIGDKCIIGAGTAVKRNLSDNSMCKIATDNNIIKEYSSDVIESKLMTNHNIR